MFHPHLHCVVTGGGLSADGKHWVGTRKDFFLSVKVLGKLFRGKFLHALKQAYLARKLRLDGSSAISAEQKHWRTFLDGLYHQHWVVYAKPPFAGPEQVFRYLGRYTHRIAISNHRLVAFDNGRVSFTMKDYAQQGQLKVMSLDAVEFIPAFPATCVAERIHAPTPLRPLRRTQSLHQIGSGAGDAGSGQR